MLRTENKSSASLLAKLHSVSTSTNTNKAIGNYTVLHSVANPTS